MAETQSPVTMTIRDYEVVEHPEGKRGPKPKQLVAVEVYGYQVGRGRTQRVVNPDDVYKLAQLGLNDREIARYLDVQEDTLRNNFSDIMAKGREELKVSLRRAQLKLALSGNAVMLIWLGKNILGQRENPMDTDDTKVLPWRDDAAADAEDS